MNNYFNQNGAKQIAFYRVPKALFTEEKYKALSTDSKMLYGLLLDRMSLSLKNDWVDRQGRVYQFFTVQQAQELLGFGHEKICRLLQSCPPPTSLSESVRDRARPASSI